MRFEVEASHGYARYLLSLSTRRFTCGGLPSEGSNFPDLAACFSLGVALVLTALGTPLGGSMRQISPFA